MDKLESSDLLAGEGVNESGCRGNACVGLGVSGSGCHGNDCVGLGVSGSGCRGNACVGLDSICVGITLSEEVVAGAAVTVTVVEVVSTWTDAAVTLGGALLLSSFPW